MEFYGTAQKLAGDCIDSMEKDLCGRWRGGRAGRVLHDVVAGCDDGQAGLDGYWQPRWIRGLSGRYRPVIGADYAVWQNVIDSAALYCSTNLQTVRWAERMLD